MAAHGAPLPFVHDLRRVGFDILDRLWVAGDGSWGEEGVGLDREMPPRGAAVWSPEAAGRELATAAA